ncbi:putative flavin-nucleotide-binding protein [Mycolicibacterium chubuense NBB4]|uniref:Putative flavin-nucleotide-binding protein n=1 Tax=Mycolicibacterium chubuense (strain NBB4) TaxID=710421 RepID=I4BG78_MYCCN|nr:pyridoxamine 5'-phosphate oxidase family protein [Mycolicibacterium chubuense]AFM16285.1 putative flavin-nucleotide-binding protein [Mycolicibacterium chubuense NBB4]
MLGVLSADEIERLLGEQTIARIGCVSDDRPYVVPTCYVYRDGFVYGHTMAGMKRKAMRDNPNVCFEVEHVDDLANWRSVIAWGRFEELHDEQAREGMALLVDRLMPLLPVDHDHHAPSDGGPGDATVYRILLREKTGRFEGGPAWHESRQ